MPLRQLYPDPKSSADGHVTSVDIVAVHGLNPRSKNDTVHALDTWRTPPGPEGRLWLRDDLPQHLPESRIFFFEYNSTAIYGKDRGTFIDKANELLEAIRVERIDAERRPLLLLGHSMGGLLIKQDLINAHNDASFAPIKDATKGLAFFATPHHGGNPVLVGVGGLAAKIATSLGFQKGDDMLTTLKSGSLFSDIMQEQWRHQLAKYSIVSFWGAFDNVVPRRSAQVSMAGDREKIVKLNADHRTVCKFGTCETDLDNFKLVQRNLKDIYDAALKSQSSRNTESNGSQSHHETLSYPLSAKTLPKAFVQRILLRDRIREQLCRECDEDRKGEPRKVGIWGLGGAGKSQLALSYLQRYRDDYDATFWIEAGQLASIDKEFLEIAELLPGVSTTADLRREVLAWFASRAGRWLMVFDGVDHYEGGSTFAHLARYIPAGSNVHVIVTSRNDIAAKFSTFDGVHVGDLEESQAVELFFRCSEISRTQADAEGHVRAIVEELGYLALAVTIAGTYLSQTPRLSSNLPRYLDDYRQRRQTLLNEQPDEFEAIHGYNHSLMTVWETSYSAVQEQLPEACQLLTLLTHLNCEDIFVGLFRFEQNSAFKSDYASVKRWSSLVSQHGVDIHAFDKCLAILEQYSLLKRHPTSASYSIHRLVHAWGRDRMVVYAQDTPCQFSLAALDLLCEAIACCPNSPDARLRLIPHIMENLKTVTPMRTCTENNHLGFMERMLVVGNFVYRVGRFSDAVVLFDQALEPWEGPMKQRHYGYRLVAMNGLVNALSELGHLDRAALMAEHVYQAERQLSGNDYPNTLFAMRNYSVRLSDLGDHGEAHQLSKQVWASSQQLYDEDHQIRLWAQHDYAIGLCNLGRHEDAIKLLKEVAAKARETFGSKHESTLIVYMGLATAVMKTDELDEAQTIFEEYLPSLVEVFGASHPRTIRSRAMAAVVGAKNAA